MIPQKQHPLHYYYIITLYYTTFHLAAKTDTLLHHTRV